MTDSLQPAVSGKGGAMPLADDLMRGADEIRRFIFGEASDQKQAESDTRAVYHLASKGQLGLFKLGGVLCGRKSTILKWIERQESTAA